MLRKGFIVAALAALFSVPTLSKAQVVNPWELTLGGGASNSVDFDGFSANLNASLGYFFTDTLEVAVRQTIAYSDVQADPTGDSSAWNASTRVALDLHFPMGDRGQIMPFIGANIGFIYGESVNDTWIAGPEAGVKVFLDEQTFVFILAEYQFFFDEADEADDAFDDGAFVYSVGLGFRF